MPEVAGSAATTTAEGVASTDAQIASTAAPEAASVPATTTTTDSAWADPQVASPATPAPVESELITTASTGTTSAWADAQLVDRRGPETPLPPLPSSPSSINGAIPTPHLEREDPATELQAQVNELAAELFDRNQEVVRLRNAVRRLLRGVEGLEGLLEAGREAREVVREE